MRAFELQPGFGLDNLKLVERPELRPGPGQVLVAICEGILYTIAFLIIGQPYALLLGASAFILTIVPFLGATILCVIAFIIAVLRCRRLGP